MKNQLLYICTRACARAQVCVHVLVYILPYSTPLGVGGRTFALNANRNEII